MKTHNCGQKILMVPMPSELSHTGQFRWAQKPVDGCIASIVEGLNKTGIYTANCCCGHGVEDGSIILHDGRTLKIQKSGQNLNQERDEAAEKMLFALERCKAVSGALCLKSGVLTDIDAAIDGWLKLQSDRNNESP